MPQCAICEKSPHVDNSVSHANNRTKRRWEPNLQRVRILLNGKVTSTNVCTQCIRSGRIVKAPHGAKPVVAAKV